MDVVDPGPYPAAPSVIEWLRSAVPWAEWWESAGVVATGRLGNEAGGYFLFSISQPRGGGICVSGVYATGHEEPSVHVSLFREVGAPLEAFEAARLLGGREAFETAWLPVVEAQALLLAAALSRGHRGTA